VCVLVYRFFLGTTQLALLNSANAAIYASHFSPSSYQQKFAGTLSQSIGGGGRGAVAGAVAGAGILSYN